MKRPEGFDEAAPSRPGAAEPAGQSPRAERRPARVRQLRVPRTDTPAEEGPAPIAQPRPQREPRRVSEESAARAAERELRLAERARKRAEKRELKRFTRRQRRRQWVWLSVLGFVAVLAGLILVAVFSPLLALREVRVEGTQRLDPAVVVDAIDGQMGVPLALLDESVIREELGQFTLIRSYTTELAPPGTLIVRIAERTPVGSVVRGAQFDLVDAAGVVIESSATRPDGVPVIQVASGEATSPAFVSATEVIMSLPPEMLAQVDTVSASTRDDVTLQLVGSNQRVEWGSAERSEHKARVLAALVAIHAGDGAGLYDVSAPGSAVFRSE